MAHRFKSKQDSMLISAAPTRKPPVRRGFRRFSGAAAIAPPGWDLLAAVCGMPPWRRSHLGVTAARVGVEVPIAVQGEGDAGMAGAGRHLFH